MQDLGNRGLLPELCFTPVVGWGQLGLEVVMYAGNPTYLRDRGRRNAASLNLVWTEKQEFLMTSSLGMPKDPWTNGLSLGWLSSSLPHPNLLPLPC